MGDLALRFGRATSHHRAPRRHPRLQRRRKHLRLRAPPQRVHPDGVRGQGDLRAVPREDLAGESHVAPINRDEQKHLGNTYFITKLRLSCQAAPDAAT